RGRERSRKYEDIAKEFKEMVDEGYKDITLLGQNVNSYGKGLEEDINFPKLLNRLAKVDGDFRIRFMTSHPVDFDEELVDVIAENEKICNHIHLPVQCGSDRILKLMNRHYTISEYFEKVKYAREKIKGVSFTSDIIVGFPGETYEEFRETIETIKKVKFNALFTFIYSKRKGTRAEKMEDTVPEKEKSRWFTELIDQQRIIGKELYNQCIGEEYKVLVEDQGKSGDGYLTGKTDSNIAVDFLGDESLMGKFVKVKIKDSLNWALLGELINE
ncbi:MAG: MiaB/RimO family radical SAM methylthiotransferase, partial [Oscillospiraceae bacterium]